ncbi:MAG: sigma 54-interacting transcriptional regulator [Pirellulaceae bacterium]
MGRLEIDSDYLPRILIIDDQYGRCLASGQPNRLRHAWRMTHGLIDETGDKAATETKPRGKPVARVVFHSGQQPGIVEIGTEIVNDIAGTMQFIRDGWEGNTQNRWACVLVDLEFLTGKVTNDSSRDEAGAPEGVPSDRSPHSYFGLRLIDEIRNTFPDLPVVILSSNKQHQDAISERYERKGVKEFIDKQCTAEELRSFIWDEGLIPDELGLNVGFSLSLLKALRTARKAASTKSFVMVTGETGTGKQPLVQYLMQWSARSGRSPQLEFNCAKLESELGGSQLFGHIKGAYTHATFDKVGIIEAANGGDLFLDELSWLSREYQAKLLKVIEDGNLTRLGEDENKFRKVDVRIIGGTNANLDELVAQKQFQSDFLFRVDVIKIELPPLSSRFEDLKCLVANFIRKFDRQPNPRRIGTGLLEHLMSYSWPGNIRELSNRVQRACVFARNARNLLPEDIALPKEVIGKKATSRLSNDLPTETTLQAKDDIFPLTLTPQSTSIDSFLPATLSVCEFLEWVRNIELTADTLEELRGTFSFKDHAGAFDESVESAAIRILLLALQRSVNDVDARNGDFNFEKAAQVLVDDDSVKKTKIDQLIKKFSQGLTGVAGEQLLAAVEKKKNKSTP